MNAYSAYSACIACIDCTAIPALPAADGPRWLASARRNWSDWRAAALHRRRLRALRHLDAATLRDIGLADQVPAAEPSLLLTCYDRGLW